MKKELLEIYKSWGHGNSFCCTQFNCFLKYICYNYNFLEEVFDEPCRVKWQYLYKLIGKNLDIESFNGCHEDHEYGKIQKDFIKYLKNNRLEIE